MLQPVCDVIREKAEKAAEKYSIPQIYTSYWEMMATGEA